MSALPRPAPGVLSAHGSGTFPVARAERPPVVVLEPNARKRAEITAALSDFRVHEAQTLSAANAMLTEVRPRAVVCSMAFDPLELLCFARWLRGTFGRTVALIVLTPRGDIVQAVRALQLGARACIDVPLDPVRLRTVVGKHAAPIGEAAQARAGGVGSGAA